MRDPIRLPLFLLLAVLLAVSSCRYSAKRAEGEIVELLDSLKQVHAPDSRMYYWNPTIQRTGKEIVLGGEVADASAYMAIMESVIGPYPEIGFNLLLLPESEPDRLVNGLVNNSVAHLRAGPSHREEIVTQLNLGSPVRILKEASGWYLVQGPNRYLGWVDTPAIEPVSKTELYSYAELEKVVYTDPFGFAYSEPGSSGAPVSDLVAGALLAVTGSRNGYLEITYPDQRQGWVPIGETGDARTVLAGGAGAAGVIRTALRLNGIPYLWGGTSTKAFDCSGFTSLVFFMNGTMLLRDADMQSRTGRKVSEVFSPGGLLPGDLLFFGRKATEEMPERVTHVAIYMGESEFIHASGKVKINSMDPDRENFLPDYPDIFIRAVRIVGEKGPGLEPVLANHFYRQLIPESQ